jgi:hypothetical protein
MHDTIRIFFRADQETRNKSELVASLLVVWAFQNNQEVASYVARANFLLRTLGVDVANAELLFPLMRDNWLNYDEISRLGIPALTGELAIARLNEPDREDVRMWAFCAGFHDLYSRTAPDINLVDKTAELLRKYEEVHQ